MGGAILDGWRLGGIDLGAGDGHPAERNAGRGRRGPSPASPTPGRRRSWSCSRSSRRSSTRSRRSCASCLSAQTVVVSLLAGVEAASLRERFPGVGGDRPRDAEPARRGAPRCHRALQRRRGRRPRAAARRPLFARSALRCGWRTRRSSPRSVRSPARARPMSRGSSLRLTKAGEKRGLSRRDRRDVIARETVLGTAWMAATSGEDMDSIAKRVASPKGTTEAGLAVLDRDDVLDELIAVDDRRCGAPRRGARRRRRSRRRLPRPRACPRRVAWQHRMANSGHVRRPRRLDLVRRRDGPVARRAGPRAHPRAPLCVVGVRGSARL